MKRRTPASALVACLICIAARPDAALAGPPGNTILGAYVGNDTAAVTQMETWIGRPAG